MTSYARNPAYLLNHSVAYGVAAVSCWTEFALEWHFLPSLKDHTTIAAIGYLLIADPSIILILTPSGLMLALCGEAMRKMAMFTARESFSHIVQTVRHDDHVLVTSGIYRFV